LFLAYRTMNGPSYSKGLYIPKLSKKQNCPCFIGRQRLQIYDIPVCQWNITGLSPRANRPGRDLVHPPRLAPRLKKGLSFTSTPQMGLHDLLYGRTILLHQVQAPYQVGAFCNPNPSPSCDNCLLPVLAAVFIASVIRKTTYSHWGTRWRS
jgi:hypothetical protein